MNPCPGTDPRRRKIRQREYVVDDRTDETSGRDEKDVGVHSCNCGVAETSAARMAHAFRGMNSREDRNRILYGMARLLELRLIYNLLGSLRITAAGRARLVLGA